MDSYMIQNTVLKLTLKDFCLEYFQKITITPIYIHVAPGDYLSRLHKSVLINIIKSNVEVDRLALSFLIREVPCSSLDQYIDYPGIFRGFPHLLL
jgi:hypothetical protein